MPVNSVASLWLKKNKKKTKAKTKTKKTQGFFLEIERQFEKLNYHNFLLLAEM